MISRCGNLSLFGVMAVCVHREIRAEKEKQRIIRNGRNKFNTNPKDVSFYQRVRERERERAHSTNKSTYSLTEHLLQGIKFLQSHKVIGESPEEVAEFLLKGELLNKRAIGDYLGEG